MPAKKKPAKKLTQEELFPHGGFHYRLQVVEPDGTKKGTVRTAWFQCEWHLTKHINRYKITEGQIDVREGHTLEVDPFAVKPKRKRKTTTKKPTKPAAKANATKRTRKTAKKEVFSKLDNFFEK